MDENTAQLMQMLDSKAKHSKKKPGLADLFNPTVFFITIFFFPYVTKNFF